MNSFSDQDRISLATDIYGSYGNSAMGGEASQIYLEFYSTSPSTVMLKEFVNSSVDYQLALDAIVALNDIAYRGIEIWTPEVIRDLQGQREWGGEETDEGVIEQRGAFDDEPFDAEECGCILPSAWDDAMAVSGYLPLKTKYQLSIREMNAHAKGLPEKDQALAKAITLVRETAKLSRLECSDENHWDITDAAFVFLWDDQDDMLAHALDGVLEDRYNAGEGHESQLQVKFDLNSDHNAVVGDILYLERQLKIQLAVGELYLAIRSFCD